MPQFTDADGRAWPVRVTVGLLPALRDLGFGLDDLKKAGFGDVLFESPERLVDLAWLFCRPQAAGVSREQFADRFDGDTLERFADAYMEAVLLFFPHLRRLGPAVTERAAAIRAAAAEEMASRLPPTAELVTAVRSAMRSSEPAGSSPAWSGSTPAP